MDCQDCHGAPAENAAIEKKTDEQNTTYKTSKQKKTTSSPKKIFSTTDRETVSWQHDELFVIMYLGMVFITLT